MIVFPALLAAAITTGCDRPESYDATLVFDKAAENGKYLNGTLVKASCKTGVCIYDGSSHALCLNGQWLPKLSRCPYHCRLSEFKERNYVDADPVPYEDVGNDWRLHGTEATAYCGTLEISIDGGSVVGHSYKCVDGGWRPTGRHKECDAEPGILFGK